METVQSRLRIYAVLLLLSGAVLPAARAELVVVVSEKNPLATLTEDQVADIFLGRTGYFPGGGPATPIDQSDDSPSRAEFYRTTTGKSPAQLKVYWSKLIFTGRGQPPREVGDAAAVKKLLIARPDTIGYIDSGEQDPRLKVIRIVP
ncbi:phosphate ABC transporter substrate-binding protein [Robbsia sp. Bb-Pol-6]|uniref:Phosphate ABC transporter substrate-binding protein n=1 Tax=Robbsia betulipollinis TaxID=2981849 RepID=A0ABT3ZSM9_9BURK|nr:phosphate ABC transporter substrate-binding protein [Robbsia betulipollinis]MCY0389472.1 phosphate ABC transporter substrate-binding protein [Robbsia betulipollinis]